MRRIVQYRFTLFAISLSFVLSCLFIKGNAQYFEQEILNVYYDTDADELLEESKLLIRNKILEINSFRIKEIYLEGHTDSDASDIYNMALSARRVDNVKTFFLSQGVPVKIIKSESFGEANPWSVDKSKNRRVQITFIYELDLNPGDFLRNKVILGYSYDAITKNTIPSQFVIEINGTNHLKKTSRRGFFKVTGTGQNDLSLIFSSDGYLNKEIVLTGKEIAANKDTIKLRVFLQPVTVVERITFNNIYFYTDTDKFKPESKDDLSKLYQVLTTNPDLYVEIQGHMNFPASRKATKMQTVYNYNLSHRRAKAVYTYLIDNGIPKQRLTYKGLSNFRMVYPLPKTREEEDQNKRVEVWMLSLNEVAASKE